MSNMSKMIQASTLNALMLGNFDRTISVKEFLREGDVGLGTYTGLDGEAIFEDSVAYRATAEGNVTVMKPEDGVAFGTVAHFDEHVPEQHLTDIASIELLKQKLDEQEDHFALLDEDGQIPQTLRDTLRAQAFEEALADPETVTTQITFQLIEKDGTWWVVPDQAMLDVLSGGLN